MKFSIGAVAIVGALALFPNFTLSASAQGTTPAPQPRASTNGPFSSDTSAGAISPDRSHPLDLNSASEAEFAALPGVGGTLAKAIVAGRPYRSPAELVQRNIVPENVYSKIQMLVF